MSTYQKYVDIYKRYGFFGFINKSMEKLNAPDRGYDAIKEKFEASEKRLERQKTLEKEFPYRPLFSVLVPTYETKPEFLQDLLESLKNQTYSNWQLCIADAGKSDTVKEIVTQYQKQESRISYRKLEKNGGISENTNEAEKMAKGEYICLLDHDDVLTADALYEMAKALNKGKKQGITYELLYSDEDKASADLKHRMQPHFKSDFNLELLRTNNYICHFTVIKKELFEAVGGLHKEFDGSQDYDLVLRCIEKTKSICHVPRVLYHWRMHDASTAGNSSNKTYTEGAGLRALKAHFERIEVPAVVEERLEVGTYSVKYMFHPENRNTQIFSLDEHTKRESLHQNILESDADYIVLLRPDLNIRGSNWQLDFLSYACQKDVGMVGAKTYRRSGKVDQCGLIFNKEGDVYKAFHKLPGTFKGYCRRAVLAQEVSGLCFSFVMFRKDVYEEVGGIDFSLPPVYAAMDFCLKLSQHGYRCIFDPYVEADYTAHVKTELPDPRMSKLLKERFPEVIEQGDPFYNPNFLQNEKTYYIC